MLSMLQGNSNPFQLEDDPYEVNTTYEPPADASVDSVVPAIPVGGTAPVAAPLRPGAGPAVPAAPMLQFTDSNLNASATTGSISRPAGGAGGHAQSASLLGGQPSSAPIGAVGGDDAGKYAFYNPRRYRPYFDVNTKDVVWRVTSSFLGPFKPDFMATTLESPDLYGPFWVATTLVFVTAVAGNYAAFLSDKGSGAGIGQGGNNSTSTLDQQWYTNYSQVGYSALLFYGYVFVLGMALYFVLRWFNSQIQLVNVWCIYGYSLTIFIPVSFLCIIPSDIARWLVVMVATGISGLFIVSNLKQTIFEAAPARASMVLAGLAALHLGIGLALRLYFFKF